MPRIEQIRENWQRWKERTAGLLHRMRKIRVWTLRGFLVLGLCLIALKAYAFPESDLIAYLVGGAGVGLSLGLAIIAFMTRVLLERTVTAEAHVDGGILTANKPVAAGITLRRCTVPFGFSLSISREFEHKGVFSPVHVLSGTKRRELTKHLVDTLVFPHRGLWVVHRLELTLEDFLGFTSLSWEIPLSLTVDVSPAVLPIRPLPIVASSSDSGDEMNVSQERTGDPYDMKQYDPTDGVRRIMWKTYAKSGQLFVRRPEPAYIPEGEVAVYLVANRNEDHVAGALLGYVDYLDSQEVITLFGTDALSLHEGARGFRTVPEEIRQAVSLDIWNRQVGSGASYAAYLDALAAAGKHVGSVIVFGPAGRLDWARSISDASLARGIKPSLALVPEKLSFPAGRKKGAAAKKDPVSAWVSSVVSDIRKRSEQPASSAMKSAEVQSLISRGGGELFMCERYQ